MLNKIEEIRKKLHFFISIKEPFYNIFYHDPVYNKLIKEHSLLERSIEDLLELKALMERLGSTKPLNLGSLVQLEDVLKSYEILLEKFKTMEEKLENCFLYYEEGEKIEVGDIVYIKTDLDEPITNNNLAIIISNEKGVLKFKDLFDQFYNKDLDLYFDPEFNGLCFSNVKIKKLDQILKDLG